MRWNLLSKGFNPEDSLPVGISHDYWKTTTCKMFKYMISSNLWVMKAQMCKSVLFFKKKRGLWSLCALGVILFFLQAFLIWSHCKYKKRVCISFWALSTIWPNQVADSACVSKATSSITSVCCTKDDTLTELRWAYLGMKPRKTRQLIMSAVKFSLKSLILFYINKTLDIKETQKLNMLFKNNKSKYRKYMHR